MITIRQFLGALLEETTRARVIGDAASVRVAEAYLKHDLLKGFPVPKMQIKDIEVELHFAVAPKLHGVSIFDDEEVRKNIRHQLRQFLESLPERPEIKDYFAKDAQLAQKWKSGLDDLDQRFERVLANKNADRSSVINNLSLAIENSFYELVGNQPHHGLLAAVTRIFEQNKVQGKDSTLNDYISEQVKNMVLSVDTSEQEAATLADLLDLKVFVEASELEKLNPSLLQRMKLVFTTSDRKWVVTGTGDQQKHILDRH